MSDQQNIPRKYSYHLWVFEPRPEEMGDALLDACDGDEAEAEAYAAYFREFADKDEWYSAEQVKAMAENAHTVRYNDWESVGDHWFFDHDNQSVIDTLMGVADDQQQTVLHELVAQVGRQYGPSGSEWWYETGLLADGFIYFFNRP